MIMLKFLKNNADEIPRVAVFSRMAYCSDIEQEKLKIFREIFLESLKRQIFKNFDVYIITGGIWGQESTSRNIRLIKEQDAGGLNISYLHRNELPVDRYNIQIRVDCDDCLLPGFILKCVDIYRNTRRSCFLITFRPYKYDYASGKIYKIPRGKWSRRPSMFTALCQKKEIKHFIHDFRHTRLKNITRNVFFVEDGHCILTIHGSNRLSKIKETDRYICDGKLQ